MNSENNGSSRIQILNFADPKIVTLHLTWFAFFLTFVVWFNHAPLMAAIRETMQLSEGQVRALLTLNVALAIPARVVIGSLVDRLGPRRVYTGLLIVSSFLCFGFAFASNFAALAMMRALMGFVGAGFVIGIRLVGEWFPARQVGLAEGIYGGWGNFGSAAAAMSLPTLALVFGGPEGWRYAVAATGAISLVYAVVFGYFVRDTPKGSTYFKPKRTGGLEVSNIRDFWFYLGMNVPMYGALAVLAWRLSAGQIGLLPEGTLVPIWIGLAAVFGFQVFQIYRVNHELFQGKRPELLNYKFKQVAVLDLAYLASFGSELAVVSMLPLFFLETFEGLSPVSAGLLASGFAFMNLVARPSGGWLSDRFGRRNTLAVLILGLALGYAVLGQITGSWPLFLAVAATMSCSFFVQAGEGAVFAVVPLVQRRMTGQIAGMTGAYGNVGAVLFLTALSLMDYASFFALMAVTAVATFGAILFLEEPEGHVAEVGEDGSVQLIEVS